MVLVAEGSIDLKKLFDENGISYDYEAHLRALQSDVGDIIFPELGPEYASLLFSYFKGRRDGCSERYIHLSMSDRMPFGDLYKLTKANVINGGVEYIPRNTKRYKDCPFDELLPLISQQKYNVAIKKMFLATGLIRPVVVYNSTTSEQEIRPLDEVAEANAKEIDEDMKRNLVSMLV